ncbi:MAG: transglycosylase SLT domain-containing protein [Acidobacteriota bacterium]
MHFLYKLVQVVVVAGMCWAVAHHLFAYHQQADSFEPTCRQFVQSPTPENRNKLNQFCQNSGAGEVSALACFLLGYQDFQTGEFPSAAQLLNRASRTPQFPLPDYALYFLARAQSESNLLDKAQETLLAVLSRYPESPFRRRALLLYWETAVRSKRPDLILDSMKFAVNAQDDPDAQFYKGMAHEMLEQSKPAVEAYQRVFYFFPSHGKSAVVETALTRLTGGNPESSVDVPIDWLKVRLQKLFQSRRYRDTLSQLSSLIRRDSNAAANPTYQLWQGIAEFNTERYLPAITTLSQLSDADSETQAEAGFHKAECYRRLGNYSQFKSSVDELQQRFPSSRWAEKALFSIGNYNLVRRNLEESTAYYQRIVDAFPKGDHVIDCHWRVAWQAYRLQDYARASSLLLHHLERFPDSEHRSAALYWSGRCLENQGHPADAATLYRALESKLANRYYGQLARQRLEALGSPLTALNVSGRLQALLRQVSDRKNGSVRPVATAPGSPRVQALSRIQLHDLAAEELLASQGSKPSAGALYLAAELHYKAENYLQAIVTLRRVFPNYLELPLEALKRQDWEILFPAKFENLIFQEAEKYQIDPFLALSLIRQESSFNPNARSRANAYGLMQLLPSTARSVARQLGTRRPSLSQLYDPGLNIRLGMRYLSDMLKKFNGQEDKALASYNAGDRRVDSWLSEGGYADSAEFVETIPFTETRNYVKIIFRNLWFYKALYENATSG